MGRFPLDPSGRIVWGTKLLHANDLWTGALALANGQLPTNLDGFINLNSLPHRIHGAGIYANIKGVYWWDVTVYSTTDPILYGKKCDLSMEKTWVFRRGPRKWTIQPRGCHGRPQDPTGCHQPVLGMSRPCGKPSMQTSPTLSKSLISMDWFAGENLHRKPSKFSHEKLYWCSCKLSFKPINWSLKCGTCVGYHCYDWVIVRWSQARKSHGRSTNLLWTTRGQQLGVMLNG